MIRALWLNMQRLLTTAREKINRDLAPLGLSSAEGDILFLLLTGSNQSSQEQLSKSLGKGKAAISRALDSLEKKDYILRTKQNCDLRVFHICLTQQAMEAGEQIIFIYQNLYTLATQAIPEENMAMINTLLVTVEEKLQQPQSSRGGQ